MVERVLGKDEAPSSILGEGSDESPAIAGLLCFATVLVMLYCVHVVGEIIVNEFARVVAKQAFSCPVCGTVCEAEFDEARVALAVDSLDAVRERIVRDFMIVCPDHGRQRVLLTAGRHSVEGEHVMATAFPKPIRKHVRSLLPKSERAEFDAAYAGTRLPAPGQLERWTDLAASFKPEPPRAL